MKGGANAPSALPSDWEEIRPTEGRPYYVNQSTDTATYVRPNMVMPVMELNQGILNEKSPEYETFVELINDNNYRHTNAGYIQFYNHIGERTYTGHHFSILPNITFEIGEDKEKYYLAIDSTKMIGYVKINDIELKPKG